MLQDGCSNNLPNLAGASEQAGGRHCACLIGLAADRWAGSAPAFVVPSATGRSCLPATSGLSVPDRTLRPSPSSLLTPAQRYACWQPTALLGCPACSH
ncbi:hypothetical protein VTN96DRAFT_7516 [Rasamsonia emersonii]